MQITLETFTVRKRFALTISRGTTTQTTNVWVRLQADGIEGWGEASPFSIGTGKRYGSEDLVAQLQDIIPALEKLHPLNRQEIEQILQEAGVSSGGCAAIDMALHDWLGKRAGLPLWQLWGFNRQQIVPISVTVGIQSPEAARARVRDWQQSTGAKVIKVKLGSPEGIEADQAMFLAVREEAPMAAFSVDANGGWSLQNAVKMSEWLEQHGVKYIEQPLAVGNEDDLEALLQKSPLPIFVDESCLTTKDIPRLVGKVHGINIKIMKSGGLTEALRMVYTARAFGLQVMYGCYSDSALANSAMAQIAPLADYLDLDSHLNLLDDPFVGAMLKDGRLSPNDLPGLGVEYRANG